MNAPASNNVGVSFGGDANASLTPIVIDEDILRREIKKNGITNSDNPNVISQLSEEHRTKLLEHLQGRIQTGANARNKRIRRYANIDRIISTWQKLDHKESQRELIEENTGKNMALPFNMPVLASHLNDMVSYFAEACAPVSNPFFSASGDLDVKSLLDKFNRDAMARDYYSELCLSIRSLLKYNIGGLEVEWIKGATYGTGNKPINGNQWSALDMYNTFWDSSIRDPKKVSCYAEWAARVELKNRVELLKKSLSGEWTGLDQILSQALQTQGRAKWYREAATNATQGDEGMDGRSSATTTDNEPNWAAFGLGVSTDLGPEVSGFEVTKIYCWLLPAQFGLLTDGEKVTLRSAQKEPEAFLELWKFEIVNGDIVVSGVPVISREATLAGEAVEIPMYLSFMTQDQLREAQRSFMELMRGFQRFASSMYNIYIAGMRKNVWGMKGYDPAMFDMSTIQAGDTVGLFKSKTPGRDVRAGLMTLDSAAGVENALAAVDSALTLKDKFFPSQAMPNQVANIDRAVKSQVATVVQGSTRAMRTTLRGFDSSLLTPTRIAAFRNYKRFDPDGIQKVTDESVAKLVGSGIESLESERVSDAMWQLVYAIIQNQEAMQTFDVPAMFTYLSRVDNLSTDMGMFVRQPAPPSAGAIPGAAPGQPAVAPPAA